MNLKQKGGHRQDKKDDYLAAGKFNVTLTLTDNEGKTDSDNTLAIIEPVNTPPNCSLAVPSIDIIWLPDRGFVPVEIQRVIDPDGDPATITIDSIFQDEPVFFAPAGRGVGTDTALVRAARLPRFFGGNGRVYHIGFTADDGQGGSCSGDVVVEVPIRRNSEAVDDGANFDSTVP